MNNIENESNYKLMRVLVIFDMPVEKKEERREYSRFRKFLINEGYMMLQFSVYVKFCTNFSMVKKYILHLELAKPKYGNVRAFTITENQFINMKIICGEKNDREVVETEDFLTIID